MKKQRKHYTPEDQISILRRHLLEKEPISKLCDKVGLQRLIRCNLPLAGAASQLPGRRPSSRSRRSEHFRG
jgi:hypothetical protein